MGISSSKTYTYGVWVGPQKDGETRVLRHPSVADGELLSEPEPGINTIWKAFQNSVNQHGNRNFLGTRKFISKDTFGDYEWKTYREIDILARDFASGALELNLCPEVVTPEDGKLNFIGIYSKNREEWVVTDLAAHLISATVVTFYDTLGESTIEYILDQTKLTTIVMESKSLKKIINLKKENKSGDLVNVILYDVEDESILKSASEVGLRVYKYPQVIEAGKNKQHSFKPADPETIATFCYTSGTTGVPKGAMISHRGILADVSALKTTDAEIKETDIHLSYLPLAHVMERVLLAACIIKAVSVGFFSGNAAKITEDAQLLKPTIFLGVPRIFQRVYEGIASKIPKLGYVQRSLAERAINTKLEAFRANGTLTHPVWDRLVFNKFKNALGGNVRLMVTGSAPISGDVLAFLKVCFCCPIIEAYGQTESCAAATMTHGHDNVPGHVGGPIGSSEIKLVDVPEMNYTSKDKDEQGHEQPRGEICVRGPLLFSGYYNSKENTKKAIDEDGWLHTGDVGTILYPSHALKILDRVKNIFKLSQGEYVAPEKLENVLQKSKYVAQIFVHGESLQSYVIAIIVPKKDVVIEFLKSKGINATEEDAHKYYEDKDLKKDIIKDLESLGRKNDFKGFEVIKKVHLTDEAFSLENGLLTPTMKVKRHEAKQKYAEEVKKMYSDE